jgi:hypothetical protein
MAAAPAAHGYYWGSPGTQPTWRQTEPRYYSSPSVVSIPTRGWASPGGSVISKPPVSPRVGNPPRTGMSKLLLCFLCGTQQARERGRTRMYKQPPKHYTLA